MNRDIKEIYWLAGILEGEGSFCIARDSKYPKQRRFSISVVSTDRDVIERSSTILCGYERVSGCSSNVGYKQVYQIHLTGKEAIAWMMTLYPLMSKRRKAKIKEVITEWKNYSSRLQKAYAA